MKTLIMLILTSHITIGNLEFEWLNNAEINSGWEKFTDTCELTLPANLKVDRSQLKSLIANGDPVVVQLGYKKPDGEGLKEHFNGVVTGLKPCIPMVITCEDQMWNLKRDRITDKISNGTLGDLMKKHFSKWDPKYIDANFGSQFVIEEQTHAQILEYLKEKFGLYSFFRGGRLVVGFKYDPETAVTHKFKLQDNVIEDDLEYKRKEDVRLEVRVVSIQKDGSRIEEKLGDSGGESRTMTFYDVPKKDLKDVAQRELERLKYDGFRGSFTAFGMPKVAHGDIVELSHPDQSDKAGSYWIDKVKVEFGMGGFRQKITLGPIASI